MPDTKPADAPVTVAEQEEFSREIQQIGGRTGRLILIMQASWRPMLAWQTIAEMARKKS